MSPVRSLRYIDYSEPTPDGSDLRFRWELSAGTSDGTVYDTWYDPGLSAGTYYLKISWERCEWTIDILPIVS